MGVFKSIEEARDYFVGDRFATSNGMHIDELREDGCVCSMTLSDNHRNALGGVMGGVIFTLADFAFAVASNHDHKSTVALNVSISFLSGTKGGMLTANAVCVKSGRTTSVFNVSVTDETGREVAMFIGTGFKL